MKLRYVGGNTEQVAVRDPKVRNRILRMEERDQLTQVFEGTEYHFPKPGSVLTLPSNVGGWLLGKCKPYLAEIPEEPGESSASPRRMVAVSPEETKEPAKAEKPAEKPAK